MGLSLFKKNRSIPDYPSSGLTASAQFGESMASTGQTQAMQFLKQSPLKHLHLYQARFMPKHYFKFHWKIFTVHLGLFTEN